MNHTTFMPDIQPAYLRANVGMGHFQPGHIAHAAASPISESKQSGSSLIP